MNNSKKLLKSLLGEKGLQTLEKAIVKRGTLAVVDPMELYLPLLVVPRALLSWLVLTIKPMKVGEVKTVKFPNKDDITINFQKDDIDQFRGEFVRNGKVFHSFEKQTLPSIGGHLMTIGEEYEDFTDGKPSKLKSGDEGYTDDFSARLKEKLDQKDEPKMDMVSSIMDMSDISKEPTKDAEAIKWEMSHANVRELTSVIGKLVDALTAKHMASSKVEDELDKMSTPETKEEPKPIIEQKTPEEIGEQKEKQFKKDPSVIEDTATFKEMVESDIQPSADQKIPEQKEIKNEGSGELVKESMPETKPKSYFRKKIELLAKPVVKGEMPKGAGQPMQPAKPKEPKPPVPASNAPAQAAAKQAQASARGSYAPPKTPNAPTPVNSANAKQKSAAKPITQAAGKPKKMDKAEYFRSKLSKPVQKSQIYSATEDQLYKSECSHCRVPEFKKGEDGNPVFNPCACFVVLRKDENGDDYKFVNIIKKTENNYSLNFSPKADTESVKVFLLTLKSRLLVKKKFGV